MHRSAELWRDLLQSHFADFLDHAAPELAARLEPHAAAFPDPEPLLAGLPAGTRRPFLLAEVPVAANPSETLLLHVLPYETAAEAGPQPLGSWLAELHTHLAARHPGPVLQLVFEPTAPGHGRWMVLPQ